MGMRQLQKGAFSNFDPRVANGFDPKMANRWNGADGSDAGSNVALAKPGQKMQINITMTNPTAGTLDFELFNYLDSFLRNRNLTYLSGAYTYIPITSYEGIQAIISDTDGTVGFDQFGNLQIRGLPVNPVATIGCSEIPYASLFEASGITAFEVAYVRFTCNTNAQIDQPIIWFQKTMAGGEVKNNINPRAYFRPNQFQDLTIDITVEFTIGVDSGLRTKLLTTERVVLALFIQAWTDQTIGQ